MKENDNGSGNDNCLSATDAYDELWRCRDFELEHFWQRSLFLGTFLFGCYLAYGGLVASVLGIGKISSAGKWMINCAAIAISIGGLAMSVLWIMMAKGSKAWYERYENLIVAFWRKTNFASDDIKSIGGFGTIEGYSKPQLSDWLWNTKGGAYSPSKINVMLGQMSLVFWFLCFAIHVALQIVGLDVGRVRQALASCDIHTLLYVLLSATILFWIWCRISVKSSTIKEF